MIFKKHILTSLRLRYLQCLRPSYTHPWADAGGGSCIVEILFFKFHAYEIPYCIVCTTIKSLKWDFNLRLDINTLLYEDLFKYEN